MQHSVILFLFLILLCSCETSDETSHKSLTLTMKMDTMIAKPCIDYILHIEPNGKTVINKDCSNSEENGSFEIYLSENQMKKIIAEIEKADFFSFKDDYSYNSANCSQLSTDSPTVTITININGKEKTVKHYYGCWVNKWIGNENALQPLSILENKIDEIVETNHWIKEIK